MRRQGRKHAPAPSHETRRFWKVAAASVRGTAHQRVDLPCQDACIWEELPGGVLTAAVADGAGSAPRGGEGAALAARTAVEAIRRQLDREGQLEEESICQTVLGEALTASRRALVDRAGERSTRVEDLATTLILVMATPSIISAAQIGDGAVVMGSGEGDLVMLTLPQTGEYANETTFLVSTSALESAQIAVTKKRVQYVAAFSDGLQRMAIKLPEGAPHGPFFAPLFRFVRESKSEKTASRQLASFLGSSRVTQRSDDDLTLLLATLKEHHGHRD